jgi:hypothetical protein
VPAATLTTRAIVLDDDFGRHEASNRLFSPSLPGSRRIRMSEVGLHRDGRLDYERHQLHERFRCLAVESSRRLVSIVHVLLGAVGTGFP